MEVIDKNEYISKIEVVRILQKAYAEGRIKAKDGLSSVLDDIQNADVQPIRRGRWIDIHEYCKMNGYIPSGVAVYYWCSECMNEQEKISDFCPCCGARMDGDTNG